MAVPLPCPISYPYHRKQDRRPVRHASTLDFSTAATRLSSWFALLLLVTCFFPTEADRKNNYHQLETAKAFSAREQHNVESTRKSLGHHDEHHKDERRTALNFSHPDLLAAASIPSEALSAVAKSIKPHAAAVTANGAMIHSRPHRKKEAQRKHQSLSDFTEELLTEPADKLLPFAQVNDSQFIAKADNSSGMTNKDVLIALAGGTGATIGGTGILSLDVDLVRRMRYQDKAVMLLLLIMYFITLGFSANFAYKQAANNSPVTFYSDPRFHDLIVEGRDEDDFIETFSSGPKDVHLTVTGFVPVSSSMMGSVQWQGGHYYDAFSFSLDLSPWVVRESATDGFGMAPNEDQPRLENGIVVDDLDNLSHFVGRCRNDLAVLELQKDIAWSGWEELATNIKLRIRQQGFQGIIDVRRTDRDTVCIYKNTSWANFMHSRTTKILCALSVVGWMLYLPYMWLRCSSTIVRARYKVDIPINSYWQLIADKLTGSGFLDDPDAIQMDLPDADDHLPQVTEGQLTVYGSGPEAEAGLERFRVDEHTMSSTLEN